MPIIDTLENTSIQQLTESFNSAFVDYSLPIVLTEEKMQQKIESEGGRLDLSVGAFHEGTLVAFILHFVDTKNGMSYVYNGGTGVVPAHRGKHLTSQMYDFILPILREAQMDRMILEVFTDNHTASKIYQNRGFAIQREVACYSGALTKRNVQLGAEYDLVELNDPDWKQLSSFWDFPPTWQNSVSTIGRMIDEIVFIGVRKENDLLGYVAFNKQFKRIHQMAVRLEYRNKGIGSALIDAVLTLESEKITFINIDTRTRGMQEFLEKRGLTNFVNQFEMEMPL